KYLRDRSQVTCAAHPTELLNILGPIERFWAFPGAQAFQRLRWLFAAGRYDRFAALAGEINRALATDSYPSSEARGLSADDDAREGGDVHRAEPPRTDRPYFEVLVVEDLSEAQERALREELRRWRRPDDPFVYEIVVVPSVDDAIMAARLNFRLQACVVRRRFTHRSRHESSFLAQFVVSSGPDDRDLGGRPGGPAQPPFPAHLPHPGRVPGAAPVHPGRGRGRGRGPVSRAVLQRAAQLQSPADRGVPRAADLARQVDRQLALDQGHARLLRPEHLPGRDVGDLRRPGLAARTHRAAARGPAAGGQDVRVAADLFRHQRDLDRQQGRGAGPGPARRHRSGRPELPPVASLRADAGRGNGDLPRRLPPQRVLDVRRGADAGDQAPPARSPNGCACRTTARPMTPSPTRSARSIPRPTSPPTRR